MSIEDAKLMRYNKLMELCGVDWLLDTSLDQRAEYLSDAIILEDAIFNVVFEGHNVKWLSELLKKSSAPKTAPPTLEDVPRTPIVVRKDSDGPTTPPPNLRGAE